MESYITNRLSTLGHPKRLALFRLLMRRYPDRVPATELARALALKPNTLSTYVNALMHAGLVTQERTGTWIWHEVKQCFVDGEWWAESEESEWLPVEGDFMYTEASNSLEERPQ